VYSLERVMGSGVSHSLQRYGIQSSAKAAYSLLLMSEEAYFSLIRERWAA
jgi:hypothetical protein